MFLNGCSCAVICALIIATSYVAEQSGTPAVWGLKTKRGDGQSRGIEIMATGRKEIRRKETLNGRKYEYGQDSEILKVTDWEETAHGRDRTEETDGGAAETFTEL